MEAWKAWKAGKDECSYFRNAASILKINLEEDFEEGCKNVQVKDNSGKEHDFRVCHCKENCNSIYEEDHHPSTVPVVNGSPGIPTCLGSIHSCPNFNFL